jgi:hypothetical protein
MLERVGAIALAVTMTAAPTHVRAAPDGAVRDGSAVRSGDAVRDGDAAREGETITIGIMPTRAPKRLTAGFDERMGTALREGIERRGVQVSMLQSECVDSESSCWAREARTLGNEFLLQAVLEEQDKDYVITLRVMTTPRGTIIADTVGNCELCGEDELLERLADAVAVLWPRVGSRARQNGSVQVKSEPPQASVQIDGELVGHTPMDHELAPGEHHIVVEHQGHRGESRSWVAMPGVRENMEYQLTLMPRSDRWPWGLGWASVGASVVGITTGAVLWAVHDRPHGGTCAASNQDTDGDCPFVLVTRPVGIGLVAAGGALLATGLTLVSVVHVRRKRARRAASTPTVSWSGSTLRF